MWLGYESLALPSCFKERDGEGEKGREEGERERRKGLGRERVWGEGGGGAWRTEPQPMQECKSPDFILVVRDDDNHPG